MARYLTYGALVAGALVLQLTVLGALPFPGGVTPDLVLLVVVAIALTSGPLPGLVSGFCGGLALDLVPPAVHTAGAYALVYCLVGYVCGRLAGEVNRSAFLPLAAMAAGALAGCAAFTLVGVTFGEPDVTWAAARHVLPFSVGYDAALSPFVLYLVVRLVRRAGRVAEDPAAALARAGTSSVPRAARGRAGEPRTPKIRLGSTGPPGWIGVAPAARALTASGGPAGAPGTLHGAGGPRPGTQARPPRLRLRGSSAPGAPAAERRGVFSQGSLVRGSAVRLRFSGGRSWLRSALAPVIRRGGRRPAQPRLRASRSPTLMPPPPRPAKRLRLRASPSPARTPAPALPARRLRFGRRRLAGTRSALGGVRRGGGIMPRRWWTAIGRPGARRSGGLR